MSIYRVQIDLCVCVGVYVCVGVCWGVCVCVERRCYFCYCNTVWEDVLTSSEPPAHLTIDILEHLREAAVHS